MTTRFIADGLISAGEEPSLIGGRRHVDGRIVFPMPLGSEAELYEPVALARRGTLWSYTVQRFRPKSPPFTGAEPFEPYAVGYVELPKQVVVESRLADVDFASLRCGMIMELAIIPFAVDPDGTIVTTYAFRPVLEQAS